MAEAYRREGYDFLALTDHNAACIDASALCRKGFLVIPGFEVGGIPLRKGIKTNHIIGLGLRSMPRVSFLEHAGADAVIRWIRRHGGIAFYCHPYWCGHDIETMVESKRATGVEVFNSAGEKNLGRGDSSTHFDQALHRGIRWTAIAVDDMHDLSRDPFGGWIMVKAAALTEKGVLAAIACKRFYATQGPQIKSLSVRGNIARIECSPVLKIAWHSRVATGTCAMSKGPALTAHEFDVHHLAAQKTHLRVEITDAEGRKAWSNPIWSNPALRRWEE